jgi:hypothetical protein
MGKSKNQQRKNSAKSTGSSKFQNAEKRQGRRFLFVWLPIIVIVVLCFYTFMFDPPRPFGQPVPGVVREGEQARSGEGTNKTYAVLLDDGRTVRLDGSQMGSSLEAGSRVLVQENVTLLFRRTSFSFVRYIN